MNKALTIAGSDCSGGAGVQADLKTFTAFGVYGMSVITSVVAENTVGVQAVFDIPAGIVDEQIKSVLDDIGADAVKIGMLSNPEITEIVIDCIKKYNLKNVVVDPVMDADSGDPLLSDEARPIVKDNLLPLATVITPNIVEAELFLGRKIDSVDEMHEAAAELKELGGEWVVLKGGHLVGVDEAIDVVYDGEQFYQLRSPFFNTPNTHGSGCTFSSAIAAGLAKGYKPLKAIRRAKDYITAAIQQNISIGKGFGPTNHLVGVESNW